MDKPSCINKYTYHSCTCIHNDINTFVFAFRIKQPTETKGKRKKQQKERTAVDDDVVEDLVLSSDEDEPSSSGPSAGKNDNVDRHLPSKQNRKPKHKTKRLKRNKSHSEGKKLHV